MKLISSKFIRNIAPQLDLMNTIGGGVAQPLIRIDKRKRGIILRVALPTVAPESFHVVLNDQRLTIYGEYRHEPDDDLAAPLFVNNFDLPKVLDLSNIDAVHEGHELQVRIPYKDAAGHQREIDIRHS